MKKSYTKIDDFLDIIACDFKKYLSSSQLPFFSILLLLMKNFLSVMKIDRTINIPVGNRTPEPFIEATTLALPKATK